MSAGKNNNNKIYFGNLDGLRTVACLMVFCWHALSVGVNGLRVSNPFFNDLQTAFLSGRNGVSIFFVLSGFLISYLVMKETESRGKLNLGNFYVRRVLRIWPLYFLVLFLVFTVLPLLNYFIPLINRSTDVRPAWYFFFLGNFDVLRIFETGGIDFLPSTITWSVAIEEQFYIFWPLFFLLIPVQKLPYFLGLVLLGSLAFRIMNYDQPYRLYYHSFSAAFDLSLGGLFAWLSLYAGRFRHFFTNLAEGARVIIVTAGLCLMVAVVACKDPLLNVGLVALQSLFFATVIIDQALHRSATAKFSNNKWLTRLGRYTYGMYMLHPIVLTGLNTFSIRVLKLGITDLTTLLIDVLIGLPLTILLAILSYHFIEKRFLLLKEKFSFTRPPLSFEK